MNKENPFTYLMNDIATDIKSELKNHIDNFKRHLLLKHYGHLNPSLPERFLIQLSNMKTPMQTIIPPNTSFILQNEEQTDTIKAITAQTHDVFPVKSIQTKIHQQRFIIEIQMSIPCYLSQDYIRLWLNPHYPADVMFALFESFNQQKLSITLTDTQEQKFTQTSLFTKDLHHNLPINSIVLDQLLAPNLYYAFKIPLKKLFLPSSNGYMKTIHIETEIPKIKQNNENEKNQNFILQNFAIPMIKDFFSINLIPVYHCQRDFSLPGKLDQHHHEIKIRAQNLCTDYELMYPLNLYIKQKEREKKIILNETDLYLDLEKQTIQNYYESEIHATRQHISIDGLWHRKIQPENYKRVSNQSLQINSNYQLIQSHPAVIRKISNSNYDSLLNCFNEMGISQSPNLVETICCFLLTGQIDTTSRLFDQYQQLFIFKDHQIIPKLAKDQFQAQRLQHIFQDFIRNNTCLYNKSFTRGIYKCI